jgi:excisionase family DNA binding protein
MDAEQTQPALLAELVSRVAEQLERTRTKAPRAAYPLEEIATMCGVSKRVIETQINTGQLRAKRIGRSLLVTHRELERWLNG